MRQQRLSIGGFRSDPGSAAPGSSLEAHLDLTASSHARVVEGHLASLGSSMILALDAHMRGHPHHRRGLNDSSQQRERRERARERAHNIKSKL